MTWLVKTLMYPPSTMDVIAHQRYADEEGHTVVAVGMVAVDAERDGILIDDVWYLAKAPRETVLLQDLADLAIHYYPYFFP